MSIRFFHLIWTLIVTYFILQNTECFGKLIHKENDLGLLEQNLLLSEEME